jgi:hypothetical protein
VGDGESHPAEPSSATAARRPIASVRRFTIHPSQSVGLDPNLC